MVGFVVRVFVNNRCGGGCSIRRFLDDGQNQHHDIILYGGHPKTPPCTVA